jgi:hypothetical protein
MHIPFSFPLDRRMQAEIEDAVRLKTGERLNELMGPEDTAVLEPLGYFGWAARNKTIYDMPGLGSRISVEALKSRKDPYLFGLVDALKPTFIVMRPLELNLLKQNYPKTAALYTPVARIQARPNLDLSHLGYEYRKADADFTILKKQAAPADRAP